MKRPLKQKEIEMLSAYLDNQLSGKDKLRVESNLENEKAWITAFENLQLTRRVLQQAPKIKIPHNFTLRPEMVNAKRRSFNSYPTMRLISSIASLLFALVFVGDFMYKGVNPVSDASDQISFSSADIAEESAGEPSAASMDDAESMEVPQDEMAPALLADMPLDDSLESDPDQADNYGSNGEAEAPADAPSLLENSSTPTARITLTDIPAGDTEDNAIEEDENKSSDQAVGGSEEIQNNSEVEEKIALERGIELEKQMLQERIKNLLSWAKWALGISAILAGIQSFRFRHS